jgi:hypothetical protein
MGGPVKIECGPRNKKTPVFVTLVDSSFEPVELRIGDSKLTADKTRFVRLRWEEADRIADALRDAVFKEFEERRKRRAKVQ